MKFEIIDIIPPRPGARVGTLVFEDDAPVKSMVVGVYWMRATHVRIGGSVSLVGPGVLRYHWEDLPEDVQQVGIMDELYPGLSSTAIERALDEQG